MSKKLADAEAAVAEAEERERALTAELNEVKSSLTATTFELTAHGG
jgi:hypothetical protein